MQKVLRQAQDAQQADGRRQNPPNHWRLAFSVQHSAFTLVEMLVVITIIGILASLVTVGAYSAIEAAKRSRMRAELNNIAMAFSSYKEKFGDYPPSVMGKYRPNVGSPTDVPLNNAQHPVFRHLAKAFPRCDPLQEVAYIPRADGSSVAAGNYNANSPPMNPAQAMVFWLTSISKDPARPLSAPTTDRQSFFDFDKARIKISPVSPPTSPPSGWQNVPGWQIVNISGTPTALYNPVAYFPQDGHGAPYVYFKADTYFDHNFNLGTSPDLPAYDTTLPSSDGGKGTCKPYISDTADKNGNGVLDNPEWDTAPPANSMDRSEFQAICVNPKSFQLIAAGLDGDFGGAGARLGYSGSLPPPTQYMFKAFPSGGGYATTGEDDDNITNFSEKALGDAKP